MFCAQIQLLKVDSVIAFKREGASFPLHSKSLPCRQGFISLKDSGKHLSARPGYLQTVMVIMVWAEFGKLGKRFRLKASERPKDRPSALLICPQDGQFSQKPQGKISWDNGFGSWILF